MEFENLEDAIAHAKTFNQNVKKQDNVWITTDRVIIPIEQVIADLRTAIENEENEEVRQSLIEELKRLRGIQATTLSIRETGKIISI